MPLEFKDRVKDQTNTVGTGTVTIDGVAPTGYRTITSAHTTGSTVRYTIVNGSGTEWEVGEGVWTTSGATLTRATVYASSNSGALVNFSAGAKAVFTGPVAADRNGSIDTNLSFIGTGLRITGDFSNATPSNRVLVQTSTANSQTLLGVIPSGTATNAQFQANNAADPNNASVLTMAAASSTVRFVSANTGTGSLLPMVWVFNSTEVARLTTSGNLLINTTTDNATDKLQITGSMSLSSALRVGASPSAGTTGQVLTSAGAGAAPTWSAVSAASMQEFTTSGTWTKPSGATFVMVEAWGPGGGGGSGRRGAASSARHGGNGGGGGAYTQRLLRASDLGATETVTIGAGGNGGAAITANDTNGNYGAKGGTTTFGTWLAAYGGAGGAGGTASASAITRGGGALSTGDDGVGGDPAAEQGTAVAGGFGAGASFASSGAPGPASGWGGGGGGATNTSQVGQAGGCSFQGGPGGGAGGGFTSGNAATLGGAGGTFAGASGGGPIQGAGSGRQGGGGGLPGESTASVNFLWASYGNGTFAAAAWNTNSNNFPVVITSTDGITWTQKPAPVQLTFVEYGNSVWLVGSQYDLFTTTDFVGYNRVTAPGAGIGFQAIRYLNGVYIAVGFNGLIATSTDLVTWTTRTSGTTNTLQDVTWTGTNYVVVGTGTIRYSSDLSSWAASTGFAGNHNSVASNGSGLVVAVSTAGTAYYSTNHGATWTTATTSPSAGSDDNDQIAFGGGNFVFANGASQVYTTSDGITWTLQTDGTTDAYYGVAYSGSLWFVGSGSNNTNAGITSSNLTTWTTRTVSALSAGGGAGGAGGSNWGGGGGGGAASTNGNNSGAGGAGANGRVRVYTW